MKKYFLTLALFCATACYAAGSMTVEQTMQQYIAPHFTPSQAMEIRTHLEEAKASEEAFEKVNHEAKIHSEQLKAANATKEELLHFATEQMHAAQAQVKNFQATINKFHEKSKSGNDLSSHMPHMGLNASPQIYEEWYVIVEDLKK